MNKNKKVNPIIDNLLSSFISSVYKDWSKEKKTKAKKISSKEVWQSKTDPKQLVDK